MGILAMLGIGTGKKKVNETVPQQDIFEALQEPQNIEKAFAELLVSKGEEITSKDVRDLIIRKYEPIRYEPANKKYSELLTAESKKGHEDLLRKNGGNFTKEDVRVLREFALRYEPANQQLIVESKRCYEELLSENGGDFTDYDLEALKECVAYKPAYLKLKDLLLEGEKNLFNAIVKQKGENLTREDLKGFYHYQPAMEKYDDLLPPRKILK